MVKVRYVDGQVIIELWNVVAVPNSNLSPCASMYRIKARKNVFFAKTNFYTMSSINRKIPYGKEVAKVRN